MRAEGDAGFARQRAQEGVGLADQQAAAVAAEAVGGDAAAMGHAYQRLDRAIDDGAARRIVELRDQAEATGVPLVAGVVKTDRAGAVLLLHRYSIADVQLDVAAGKIDTRPGLQRRGMTVRSRSPAGLTTG